MPEEEQLEVEALITESDWRPGRYGRYALAQVFSSDMPAELAICDQVVKGVKPPTGSRFRCKIERSHRGWRIVEILVDGLPQELIGISGVVREVETDGREVHASPLPSGPVVVFQLDNRCLREAKLVEIDVETPIVFDGVRGHKGYKVAKILQPTAAAALPAGKSPQGAIALVQKEWDVESQAKGVNVSVRSVGSVVAAKVFVTGKLLRGAGIERLVRANRHELPSWEESDGLLSHWESVLREGTVAERDELEIDRLELLLEWVEACQEWRIERLLRPCSLREPKGPKEVVDWVSGTVLTERVEANSREQRFYVEVSYQDQRVGRGTARLYAGEQQLMDAGLEPGVPVMVRLESKEKFWNIGGLHRSRPKSKDAALPSREKR
jgi:hypothetical protein